MWKCSNRHFHSIYRKSDLLMILFDRLKNIFDFNKDRKESKMKLIVGLGNPGREYVNTRHNAGFYVVEKLAYELGEDISERKYKGVFTRVRIGNEKAIILEPLTYMNNSGESVRAFMDYFKIDASDVIVIYDDINLKPGNLRIRLKGSAGGHNGIKSLIAHIGTSDFPRIKVGVGEKPPKMDLADHVLGHFNDEDKKLLDEAASDAIEAIRLLVAGEYDMAMNRYNVKKTK